MASHAFESGRSWSLWRAPATGFAAGRRVISRTWIHIRLPALQSVTGWFSTAETLATAAVIGVGTHVAILAVLAPLPRMTTRRWIIAVAIVAILLAVKVHLSRVADQYLAEQRNATSRNLGRCLAESYWSGPLDDHRNLSIGSIGGSPSSVVGEELKGREARSSPLAHQALRKVRSQRTPPPVPIPPDPPEPN